jgi:phosphoglycerol transferase MdoB-like AlkP superfamily enzyme
MHLQTRNRAPFFPRVLPQVKGVRSSDAQRIINAGLLPVNFGATCFSYPYNRYYTLGEELQRHRYTSCSMYGYESSFWNFGIFSIALAFDTLIPKGAFRQDDFIGVGLNDSSFLVQTAEKLTTMPWGILLRNSEKTGCMKMR